VRARVEQEAANKLQHGAAASSVEQSQRAEADKLKPDHPAHIEALAGADEMQGRSIQNSRGSGAGGQFSSGTKGGADLGTCIYDSLV